jgi:uncharacterized protein (DUF2237 family)
MVEKKESEINVLGSKLVSCCQDPITGFYRDGFCHSGPMDLGSHVVCAVMTKEFLEFTKSQGNDLTTPVPAYNFPGLIPGNKWCLCVSRWKEAYVNGVAPKVILESTHHKALEVVSIEDLASCAIQ